MKLHERNDAPIDGADTQNQMSDVAKGREVVFWDPSAMFHIQRSSVACRGVDGVRKRVAPGRDVGVVSEADGGEDVFLTARCPRFGDDGTGLEDIGLIAELVDDVVVNLGREPWTGRQTSCWSTAMSRLALQILPV